MPDAKEAFNLKRGQEVLVEVAALGWKGLQAVFVMKSPKHEDEVIVRMGDHFMELGVDEVAPVPVPAA